MILIVATVHFILQFIAWSFAPGNTARDLSHLFISKWWKVLSFPVFWLPIRDGSNVYFWVLLLTNSIVWGLVASGFFTIFKKCR